MSEKRMHVIVAVVSMDPPMDGLTERPSGVSDSLSDAGEGCAGSRPKVDRRAYTDNWMRIFGGKRTRIEA